MMDSTKILDALTPGESGQYLEWQANKAHAERRTVDITCMCGGSGNKSVRARRRATIGAQGRSRTSIVAKEDATKRGKSAPIEQAAVSKGSRALTSRQADIRYALSFTGASMALTSEVP